MVINPLKSLIFSFQYLEMHILPALIGAGAALIGAKMSSDATKDATQQSIASAREQMAFQERMSNTAHQREITDLKAAGLNPILAAKYGGASTPGGSMPQIQSAAPVWTGAAQQVGNMLTSGVQSVATAKNLETQNAKIQAETKQIEQNIKNLQSQKNLTDAQVGQVEIATNKLREETNKIIAEFDSLNMKNATEGQITDFLLTHPTLLEIQAASRATGVDVGDILDLIPSMKSISNAWNNIFGKGKKYGRR